MRHYSKLISKTTNCVRKQSSLSVLMNGVGWSAMNATALDGWRHVGLTIIGNFFLNKSWIRLVCVHYGNYMDRTFSLVLDGSMVVAG
jgi:hypothetical protein